MQQLLIAFENVAGVDLLFHVIKTRIVAVRNYDVALRFEFREVVHDAAAEECRAVAARRLRFNIPVYGNADIKVVLLVSTSTFQAIFGNLHKMSR